MKKTFTILLCLALLFGMTAALAETWTCPNCGGESEGAFCPWCGQKKPEEIVCPECGAVYDTDAGYAFCMTCGTPLTGGGVTADVSVGDIVTFGHYEQDNNTSNGQEAIEWIVLAREGDQALLLSKYGLDVKPYNTKYIDITWKNCTLREWLNNDFLNAAFAADEQGRILLTDVDNSKGQGNSEWDTSGGNNTQDKVFLLSYNEAWTWFSGDEARICAPTDYAIAHGAYLSSNNKVDGRAAGWWWLRSPGNNLIYAANIFNDGSRSYGNVNYDNGVVRPALWIKLESEILSESKTELIEDAIPGARSVVQQSSATDGITAFDNGLQDGTLSSDVTLDRENGMIDTDQALSSSDLPGTWAFESASYMGMTNTAEDFGMTFAFELRNNGTATFTVGFGGGETTDEGTWSFSGETGILVIGNDQQIFCFRDGRIIIEDAFGTGITMYCEKTTVEESTASSGPVADEIGTMTGESTPSSGSTVGDIITFGHYEQDNDLSNGQEAIEWIVLAQEDERILLISRYGLDTKPYNRNYTSITWENSTLRQWLDIYFLNTAFTVDEQAQILLANVDNSRSQGHFNTYGGNDTQDRVFLLSYNDAMTYFSSDEARKCVPTDYAIAQGAYTSISERVDGYRTGWWWLRSPGNDQISAANVGTGGSPDNSSVSRVDYVVRPACWIKPDSEN